MIKKTLGVIVILVIGLLIGIVLTGGNGKSLGGTVEVFPSTWTNGLYIGNSGTLVQQINKGTCTLTGTTTLATSTAVKMSCAATSVKSGDVVMIQPSSAITVGWEVIGASASTTAGIIDVIIHNESATTTIPSTLTTGVQYQTFR